MVQYLKDLSVNPEFKGKLSDNLKSYGLPAATVAATMLGANYYFNKKKRTGESKKSRRNRIRRNLLLTGIGGTVGVGGLLLGKALFDSNLSLSSRLLNQPYKGGLTYRDAIQSGDEKAIDKFKKLVDNADTPSVTDASLGWLTDRLVNNAAAGAGAGGGIYLGHKLTKRLVPNAVSIENLNSFSNTSTFTKFKELVKDKPTKWQKFKNILTGGNIDDSLRGMSPADFNAKFPQHIPGQGGHLGSTAKPSGTFDNVINSFDDLVKNIKPEELKNTHLSQAQSDTVGALTKSLNKIKRRPKLVGKAGIITGLGLLGALAGNKLQDSFNSD